MMLTIYESVLGLSSIYNKNYTNQGTLPNQDIDAIAQEVGLFLPKTSTAMIIAKNTFTQKSKLVDDKKKALTNISSKTKTFSDSNVTVLNNAYEASRRAFEFRLNLELSVLNSQLKSIDIEIANIKLMTAEQFTNKYGA